MGVIGHVDHGKTSLVRALTGEETDRLAAEKQRGISIALGFARLSLAPDTVIDLIDMPGHERFVRTMISGATGIDAVLLVVAANEGIKPQTIEHIDIAALLGLRHAIIAISKIDLVTPEQALLVAAETQQLLTQSGFVAPPPIMMSVPRQIGFAELRQALQSLASSMPPRDADGVAFLPIDRAFGIAGHGPVVTGTLRGAAIAAGDKLEIFPARQIVRVRTVQLHGETVVLAPPGQRVALNLRDIDLADLQRGMVLAAPGHMAPCDWLTISLKSVAGAPPLKNGMRLRALLGTDEIGIRLRLLDRDILDPGQSGFAQLHGATPTAMLAGEPVILRLASPPQTVAGGKILEPETRRQRRHSPQILARLEDLKTLPPAAMLNAEIARQAAIGTTLHQLSRISARATPRVLEMLQTLPVAIARSGMVVWQAEMDRLLTCLPVMLAPHAGLSHDALLAALPGTGKTVLDEALDRLMARGNIGKRGGQFFIPRPDEDMARRRAGTDLASQLADMLQKAGLSPPTPAAIITTPQTRQAIERLLRDGIIIRAVDRDKKKEILFHRDAIAAAQHVLTPLLTKADGLLVTEIAAALGISRKYTMPLLDHLDGIGFTRRSGDKRVRGPAPPQR
jgi:selenocysteine-specific elongation factor